MALTNALLHIVTKDSQGNNVYTPLPDPQTMTWSIQDVDSANSGRSSSGLMIRGRVAVKRKLTCTFPPAYQAKVSEILNAVTSEYFTLRFPDAQDQAFRTMVCYVGNRSTEAYYIENKNNLPSRWLWNTVSCNFIER